MMDTMMQRPKCIFVKCVNVNVQSNITDLRIMFDSMYGTNEYVVIITWVVSNNKKPVQIEPKTARCRSQFEQERRAVARKQTDGQTDGRLSNTVLCTN